MVDTVREAPRILLQVKGREKSAGKRVARGSKNNFFRKKSLQEMKNGKGVLAFCFFVKNSSSPFFSLQSKTRRGEKNFQNMSSVRRASPRNGGAVANDLRARPGQADATVSPSWFLVERGERREEQKRQGRAMKQKRPATTMTLVCQR